MVIKVNKEIMIDNMYRWIASKLPRRFVYFVTIELWAKTTTGKYGNTSVNKLTIEEGLNRYIEKYNLNNC